MNEQRKKKKTNKKTRLNSREQTDGDQRKGGWGMGELGAGDEER